MAADRQRVAADVGDVIRREAPAAAQTAGR
jgi:hypothetical protein